MATPFACSAAAISSALGGAAIFSGAPAPSPATGGSSFSSSGVSSSGFSSIGSSLMTHLAHFIADDHGPEVVPAGLDHLCHVDHKEGDVSDRDPEMKPARHLISAEQRDQPGELHRLVNGQPRQQRSKPHQND